MEEHTGVTAVEKPFTPKVVKQAEILDGVGMENAPPLNGYVRFQARPTSDTILEVDRDDPLLVRWQYGLGRAAVFTSRRQEPLGRQLGDLAGLRPALGQHLPRPAAARAAERDHAPISTAPATSWWWTTGFRATWRSRRRCPTSMRFGPNGFQAPLKVGKVAAGHYRGKLAIGQNQGLFRVRPLVDSRAFPEVGFYRQEDEMREYGNNEPLLRQIAASTGGRYNPQAGDVFDAGGRSIRTHDGTCGRACWRWRVAAEPARADPAQVEGRARSAAPAPRRSGGVRWGML